MICNSCGAGLDNSTKFCPQCGAHVSRGIAPVTLASASAQMQSHRSRRKIIAGLFLLAAAVLVIIFIANVAASPNKEKASSSAATSPIANPPDSDIAAPPPAVSKPQSPPISGLTLHPYDLLKNPFQSRGKLVALNLNSLPVLYNGAVIQYSGPMDPRMGTRLGLMALRLERMADENVALYNIMGIEAGGSSGQTLGQMVVELPEGTTKLKFDRAWMVEPSGPLRGTNYLGAEIQIPSVRFWRYVGGEAESTDGQRQAIGPGNGFRYIKYPHGYMVDKLCSVGQQAGTDNFCYPFNWQPWIKQRVLDIAGDQSEALKTDSGASGAGNLVISWDSERRVVFQGFRPHDSMSASAYFIVAPTTQVVDIIWQRGDDIAYLGPDTNVLKNAHTYEWLKHIGF